MSDYRVGLTAALNILLGDEDIPEWVTATWVAEKFHLNQATVLQAAKTGKLPATPTFDSRGDVALYSIRPCDALLIWGHKLLARKPTDT
ncbi:MAG: hypothetical protein E6R04_04600 [Spirochaetes bacterium]|nr:MAG: hypothetical protein E6R04_04600 [Spirochaetota bacterium]